MTAADIYRLETAPLRYRAAEKRNARLAKPLGILSGTRRSDPDLLELLGRRMWARDEPAAAVARALSPGRPESRRVTWSDVRDALADDPHAAGCAPAALHDLLVPLTTDPPWLDRSRIEAGARVMRRATHALDDVLTNLSLIGGFRFGGPPDLLVHTGAWAESAVAARVARTRAWTHALTRPGGLEVGADGWRATINVRIGHAVANERFERDERWDAQRWGLPVSRTDLASTLGLFNSTSLLGLRLLGWFVTPAEGRDVMHLWKYVGWLIGVDHDWLFDTERAQNRFNYHVLLVQDDVTEAGGQLSRAVVDATSAHLGTLRGRYRTERQLSVLRWFLHREGMRELGLPSRPAWAVAPAILRNLFESLALARTPLGRVLLQRAGDAYFRRAMQAAT